jgi:hypothetical protein
MQLTNGCTKEPFGCWIRERAVELVYTSWSTRSFAEDCGYVGPPFAWSSARREHLRAELDAAYLHTYGLSAEDASHVLDGFPIVREADIKRSGTYRTKDLVLQVYAAMAAATPEQPFLSRLDPPPGDPRAAHPKRPGEEPGRWVPWSEVAGEPFMDSAEPITGGHRPRPIEATYPSPSTVGAATLTTPARLSHDAPARPTLDAVTTQSETTGSWTPESSVEPKDIVMGMRVRHRSRGAGTVLSVKLVGRGAELLIRFDGGGESWMLFGLGLLEFAAHAGA